MLPKTRPEATREGVLGWISKAPSAPFLVGRRGYYRDSMGVKGKNDRGIYDDAIFLILPDGRMKSYNANTDPTRLKPRVAQLKEGTWHYQVGTHNISKAKHRRYEALVQAAAVTVARHNAGDDTGWFGINIHKGSRNSTSSEGCQTIHPDQWDGFMKDVKAAIEASGRKSIPYVLVAREDE